MRLETCLLWVILCSAFTGSDSRGCNYDFAENRLITNLDKLTESKQVMIMRGVTLKKKLNEAVIESESRNFTCSNFVKDFQSKASRFINNHVLEFDIASMLTEGKAFSIIR
jgi:Protein of unknown function (DUF1676)